MKLESAIVACLLASLVVNVAHAAHPTRKSHAPAVGAAVTHVARTASMPATTPTWTAHTNSYRSVGR